jgi:hypothetical protein
VFSGRMWPSGRSCSGGFLHVCAHKCPLVGHTVTPVVPPQPQTINLRLSRYHLIAEPRRSWSKNKMASSTCLLHSSTLAPAFPPPELRRRLPPTQLDLRSIHRRAPGVSLAASSSAASPEVEKKPSSSPSPPNESALSVSAAHCHI